jgi:hypothetical protein
LAYALEVVARHKLPQLLDDDTDYTTPAWRAI